jgi:hypothetical protein
MREDRLAVLVGLTTLLLTGCPDEEGGDTGAMSMTLPSTDDDEGSATEATTDAMTSDGMTSMPMTSDAMTSDAMTTEPETTGSECTAEDECMVATDCPTPNAMCVGCLCVGGEETGEPPSSSDYGPCNACAAGEMPVGIMDLEGCFCSPGCDGQGSMCPPPNEGTAMAVCGLETMMGAGPSQCALVCTPGMDDMCPTGAMCVDTGMMGIGLCMHPAG